MSVNAGTVTVLTGPSGSGKSTLLHLVGGLDQPTSGSITIEGKDLGSMSDNQRTLFRRHRIGIIFQAYNLLPTLTAVENVALPAVIDGAQPASSDQRARELLSLVDMDHRLHHRPEALSGGEQQRVAIARALMNDPALILADEPTGNLDSHHSEAIWTLLVQLVKQGSQDGAATRTVIAVTHERSATQFADRVITLRDGRIESDETRVGDDHADSLAPSRT